MNLRIRLASFLSEVLAEAEPPYCRLLGRTMLCGLCPNLEREHRELGVVVVYCRLAGQARKVDGEGSS